MEPWIGDLRVSQVSTAYRISRESGGEERNLQATTTGFALLYITRQTKNFAGAGVERDRGN
jgi:hypothetical protein